MVQCGVRNTREKAGYTHDRNKTQTQFEAAFFGGGRQCKDLYDESHAKLLT
jgi:precorrin-6B methylase 2